MVLAKRTKHGPHSRKLIAFLLVQHGDNLFARSINTADQGDAAEQGVEQTLKEAACSGFYEHSHYHDHQQHEGPPNDVGRRGIRRKTKTHSPQQATERSTASNEPLEKSSNPDNN